jgi:murE/murF fusion protein
MLLKNLINNCPKNIKEIDIKGISLDSRKVKPGDLFFALKGEKSDGKKFINEAKKRGARIIVSAIKIKKKNFSIPIIKVKNIRDILSKICVKFFKYKPKNIIAVTGTNGKSSVADFFYQILLLNKIPVATIGTLGVKKNNKIKKLNLTSPDIISIHQELEDIKKHKIDNVIIEASSHGLKQGRLNGLNFKAGIFTNFSQDHLDYHKSMKNYLEAKLILFSKLLSKNRYIVTDNKIKEFANLKKISIKKKLKIITSNNINLSKVLKNINLTGLFQIKNLKMSIVAAMICGLSKKKIFNIISKIRSVNGRLELIRTLPNKTKIFVDYAHTPDALKTSLESIRSNNRLTLIFGCGGERDLKKRRMMSQIANNLCDKIYVTDDNPRSESPSNIRKEIIKHLNKKICIEIGDRSRAIEHAIKNSYPFETILIAGKGHEQFQDYGKKIIKISDKEIIKKIKVKKKRITQQKYNLESNSQLLNKIIDKKNIYKFEGVSIDSKEIKKNNLFIAIKGKKKDGHDFILQANKSGASYCVVSKKLNNIKNKRLIYTKNTSNFLNKLAIEKRKSSKAKIIGVTGSAGKTTLKHMLGNILSNYDNTYFSPKSYNNHYGVPLSLSNLENHHKFGVFEIGMSQKGEINKLSKIVKPHIGIITNVAEAHIENFKHINEIAKTKGELIQNVANGGIMILNRDDKFFNYFKKISKLNKLRIISFGVSKKSDVHLISEKKLGNFDLMKIKVFNEILLIKVNSIKTLNILSVIAALKGLNLNLKLTEKYFNNLFPLEGRGKIYKVNRFKTNFKLIDESYNANPLSVKEAIINFSTIKKSNFKKYLLLGDMLELGTNSDLYHKNLSKFINNTDIDKFFVYGDHILNTFKYIKKNKQGNILQSKNDFDVLFSDIIRRNDYLMIKGSNATGLNKICKNIIKGSKNAF